MSGVVVLGILLLGVLYRSYCSQAEEVPRPEPRPEIVLKTGRLSVETVTEEQVFLAETPKPAGPEKVRPSGQPSAKEFTNSIGIKFVLIPAGTFVMGSPVAEPERNDDERRHKVTITKSFYLQTTEVTQGQWKRVMDHIPFSFFYFLACGEECPAENVSSRWAQEFIRELNAMEGTNKYRLPTEAEWEYACRAGSETAYHFGDNEDVLGDYAWYLDNSLSNAHPVGQKKHNAWGLYDMHGNVAEWCQDWYGDYPGGHVTDPKGPSTGKYRLFRGGSWDDIARVLRSAFRGRYTTGARLNVIGFRVARDA
jgi:formylglycine-generating enzyme required for sulfatase activity